MSTATVTLIVNVRERFSYTAESLRSLLDNTKDYPYELVYVDVNSPPPIRQFLQRAADEHEFTLVRVNRYVAPNAARNIGVRYAETKYVVFLDNDVEFTPGWLPALVTCAEQEQAWLVGPLYLHGPFAERSVHMAGGDMSFSGPWGDRSFVQTQRYFMSKLDDVPKEKLVRQACDLIEFHCALARRDIFDQVGGMDEGLLTTREHLDFCQRVLAAGGSIYFEPESLITYRMPPPFASYDLPYFLLRWSDELTKRTLVHFAHKYGITPSYVDRVAKTRRRRQSLLFGWIEPKLRPVLGSGGTAVTKRLLSTVEPVANRVLVEVLSRRPGDDQPVLVRSASRTADPPAGGPDGPA